jgi:hypothetical protein
MVWASRYCSISSAAHYWSLVADPVRAGWLRQLACSRRRSRACRDHRYRNTNASHPRRADDRGWLCICFGSIRWTEYCASKLIGLFYRCCVCVSGFCWDQNSVLRSRFDRLTLLSAISMAHFGLHLSAMYPYRSAFRSIVKFLTATPSPLLLTQSALAYPHAIHSWG